MGQRGILYVHLQSRPNGRRREFASDKALLEVARRLRRLARAEGADTEVRRQLGAAVDGLEKRVRREKARRK